MFLHVLDPTMGDLANLIEQFEMIEYELEQYQEDLLERKRLIVINKIDIADQELVTGLKKNLKLEVLKYLPSVLLPNKTLMAW